RPCVSSGILVFVTREQVRAVLSFAAHSGVAATPHGALLNAAQAAGFDVLVTPGLRPMCPSRCDLRQPLASSGAKPVGRSCAPGIEQGNPAEPITIGAYP